MVNEKAIRYGLLVGLGAYALLYAATVGKTMLDMADHQKKPVLEKNAVDKVRDSYQKSK